MKRESENERQWPLSSSDPVVMRSREENFKKKENGPMDKELSISLGEM